MAITHMYSFNGSNSNDSVGSSNGTDTSVTYTQGNSGNAVITSSTTTSKVNTNFAPTTTSDFSIDCIISNSSFKSGDNNESTICGTRSFPNGFFLYLNDSLGATNKLTIAYASNLNVTGNTVFSQDKYYHVAIVQSGNTQKVYLNGILEISTSYTANSSGQNLTIGNASTTLDRNFAGKIDQFGFYNSELSQSYCKNRASWYKGFI